MTDYQDNLSDTEIEEIKEQHHLQCIEEAFNEDLYDSAFAINAKSKADLAFINGGFNAKIIDKISQKICKPSDTSIENIRDCQISGLSLALFNIEYGLLSFQWGEKEKFRVIQLYMTSHDYDVEDCVVGAVSLYIKKGWHALYSCLPYPVKDSPGETYFRVYAVFSHDHFTEKDTFEQFADTYIYDDVGDSRGPTFVKVYNVSYLDRVHKIKWSRIPVERFILDKNDFNDKKISRKVSIEVE